MERALFHHISRASRRLSTDSSAKSSKFQKHKFRAFNFCSVSSQKYHTSALLKKPAGYGSGSVEAGLDRSGSDNAAAIQTSTSSVPIAIHKNSLEDLEKYVGPELADRIRADLSENEHTGTNTNKTTREAKYNGVVKFWSNYIPANSPCEDRRIGLRNSVIKSNSRSSIKKSTNEISYMFGILDGHGGGWCADVFAKRIGDYFMVTQVQPKAIMDYIALSNTQISNTTFTARKVPYQIRNILLDPVLTERTFELLNASHKDCQPYWRESLIEFSREVYDRSIDVHDTKESLRNAIKRLDQDIANEAEKYASQQSLHYAKPKAEVFKKIACSGCVGTIAVIKQGMATIAHTGDTRALMGIKDEKTGKWRAKRITPEHTLENQEERDRLESEHPGEDVIFRDRVLGVLQPSRAFGDNRLKQSVDWIESVFEGDENVKNPVYPEYISPPYVISDPKVSRVPLSLETKFLIMATDGFWEQYEKSATPYKRSPETFTVIADSSESDLESRHNKMMHTATVEQQVIEAIGQHLDASEEMEKSSNENIREDIRKSGGFENNLATEAIKKALMIGDYGDSDKFYLCDMMNLRADERRRRRDDISVTIVKFGNN